MSPKKSSTSTSLPTQEENSIIPARYMTTAEAAFYLRITRRWLEKLRCTGGGPRFIRKGVKKIVYDIQHIDEWMAKDVRSSTSDPGLDPDEEA